jgi:hypothetical protein
MVRAIKEGTANVKQVYLDTAVEHRNNIPESHRMIPDTAEGLGYPDTPQPGWLREEMERAQKRTLDRAIKIVKAAGYVLLREKSYRQAQERQRMAEARASSEKEHAESTRRWAINCLDEERRLADRLTFVYGVARAHGATVEELSGDKPPTGEDRCKATHDGQRCIQAAGHNRGRADVPANHTFALHFVRNL